MSVGWEESGWEVPSGWDGAGCRAVPNEAAADVEDLDDGGRVTDGGGYDGTFGVGYRAARYWAQNLTDAEMDRIRVWAGRLVDPDAYDAMTLLVLRHEDIYRRRVKIRAAAERAEAERVGSW